MKVNYRLCLLWLLLWWPWPVLAQSKPTPTDSACPKPALSRLTRHRVAANETVESVARRYNLFPTTLIGFNPGLRSGAIPTGTQLIIPPSNGIRAEVKPGQTWRDVAAVYKVRPDLLFEANGCSLKPDRVVFVPGVNWSPVQTTPNTPVTLASNLKDYPLPFKAEIGLGYGWQLDGVTNQVAFHGGVDLIAPAGTTVLSVGDGVVAFAGEQTTYGNLVVINHQSGRQTRYAQLASLQVKQGQQVKAGQPLGTVGATGTPSLPSPHLHFEIRINSSLGWVAEDPTPYFKIMTVTRSTTEKTTRSITLKGPS